jgi:hypothetical protein
MDKFGLKDERFLFGIYNGLIHIVLNIVYYIIDPRLFASIPVSILSLILPIVFISWGTIRRRNQIGGYMSYGESLISSLNIFLLGAILSFTFLNLFEMTIATDLPNVIRDETIKSTVNAMEKLGAPESEIDKTIEQFKNQDFSPNIKSYFIGLLGSFAIGLVYSLIMAIFLRKEKPFFSNQS